MNILLCIPFMCAIFSFLSVASCAATQRFPNVVLITIDSLRADHIGAYGYGLPTTPHLDRIASEGVLFANAISQGGWTSPALVSLFTSTYPSVHGVEAKHDGFPCTRNSALTTWVQAGYQVPSYEKLREENNYARLGFQPQQAYTFKPDALKQWITAHRSHPFFCWYHINKTPHLPYNPDPSYTSLFLPKGFSPDAAMTKRLDLIKTKVIIPRGSLDLREADRQAIVALYDAEVRMADDAVHEIYTFLATERLLDNTILVITSDHGDELMDHGFIGHASTNLEGSLYNEIIRVPLIIRYPPRIEAGRVVHTIVELIDVMPTLLDIAGLEKNRWIQGTSLLPLVRSPGTGEFKVAAFSENCPCGYQCTADNPLRDIRMVSVLKPGWKLIVTHSPQSSSYSLYNLRQDPDERHNVVDTHPTYRDELINVLITWYHQNRLLRKELIASCSGEIQ